MSDLISRQAAIDAIRKGYPDAINSDYKDGLRIATDRAIYHVEQLPLVTPEQQWIPCDRELPKPNEEDGNGFHKAYLVQDGRWMDVARWDGKYWIAWGYSTVLLNVVAWMPLPAPYIPEGDDKHEG